MRGERDCCDILTLVNVCKIQANVCKNNANICLSSTLLHHHPSNDRNPIIEKWRDNSNSQIPKWNFHSFISLFVIIIYLIKWKYFLTSHCHIMVLFVRGNSVMSICDDHFMPLLILFSFFFFKGRIGGLILLDGWNGWVLQNGG